MTKNIIFIIAALCSLQARADVQPAERDTVHLSLIHISTFADGWTIMTVRTPPYTVSPKTVTKRNVSPIRCTTSKSTQKASAGEHVPSIRMWPPCTAGKQCSASRTRLHKNAVHKIPQRTRQRLSLIHIW